MADVTTSRSKVALVTGANKGIGKAIVKGLARAGFVVYLGVRDQDRGEAAAAALARDGDVRFIPLEVTDELRVGRRRLRKSGQLKCGSQQPCTQGRQLSTRADAVLHGIQSGGWDARRLPSRISRVARMRADASRSRCLFFERVQIGTPVTVVGSTDNLTRGRRALPILPTGSYVLGKRLTEVADQGGVCPRPLD